MTNAFIKPVPTRTPTFVLERETGIEPASLAWKARVLPLNYSRLAVFAHMVEEAGFEPAYSLEGRFTVCCH